MAQQQVDLSLEGCRQRQQRLLECMHEKHVDLVVLQQIPHVQWLTGARFAWCFEPAAAIDADGKVTLVGPEKRIPDAVAADNVVSYEARWLSTMRNDQRAASTQVMLDALGAKRDVARLGVEFSCFTQHWPLGERTTLIDIEPLMYQLRRRKDPDELQVLQQAIDATGAMYERARQIVRSGVNELHVFSQLQEVAVEFLGEMLTGTGNDYQSGSRGGAPRNRKIAEGELYILDLGPAYRGYFADNARTLAVGEPNDVQLEAHQRVVQVFSLIESRVRPGTSARAVFQEVADFLAQSPVGTFDHHLGHGIGLFPHEAPHLNPHWDDTFQVNEVFTVEPGLYDARLRAGLRLENDYRVTETGVELLSNFPLDF